MNPRYDDGNEYAGECLCQVVVRGPVARSRPSPYWTHTDPFGGDRVQAVLLSTATGTHDVPTNGLRRLP